MPNDPHTFHYAHAPWCQVETPWELDDPKKWMQGYFLHKCGCPTAVAIESKVLTKSKLCGYGAFAVGEGEPLAFYAQKEDAWQRSEYKKACYGFEDGVHYEVYPNYKYGYRYSKTWENEKTAEGYDHFVCKETSQSFEEGDETPNESDCNMPEDRTETQSFVVGFGAQCKPVNQDRVVLRVSAMTAGDVPSETQTGEIPAPTETQETLSHEITTLHNQAPYQYCEYAPQYVQDPCGQMLGRLIANCETRTVAGEDSSYSSKHVQTLSDKVLQAQTVEILFGENADVYAYGGLQDDKGETEISEIDYAILCSNLLKGVAYKVQVFIETRERWVGETGEIEYGEWEPWEIDEHEFTATGETQLVGGEWLDEKTQMSEANAVVEYAIPEEAPNFETVAAAEEHNLEATVRPQLQLGDGKPAYQYRIAEILIFPTKGTHWHEHTDQIQAH